MNDPQVARRFGSTTLLTAARPGHPIRSGRSTPKEHACSRSSPPSSASSPSPRTACKKRRRAPPRSSTACLVGLIAVAIIVTVGLLGKQLDGLFKTITDALPVGRAADPPKTRGCRRSGPRSGGPLRRRTRKGGDSHEEATARSTTARRTRRHGGGVRLRRAAAHRARPRHRRVRPRLPGVRARSRPPPARACGSWRCRTTRRPPGPRCAPPPPSLDPAVTDAQITITPGRLPDHRRRQHRRSA